MFRLDRLERYALSQAFRLIPTEASSWLFGSRTNRSARGGDIDVLIQVNLPELSRFELSQRLTLEFQRHCDEKIDFVVLPTIPSETDRAFLSGLTTIPLYRVVNAPILDHVAILVRDLDRARERARLWGIPLQPAESLPSEGTTEVYVGEPARSSRVLLLQATGEGPYSRRMKTRGPGIHHLGITVPNIDSMLRDLGNSGWTPHPKAPRSPTSVWLTCENAPVLMEVTQDHPRAPRALVPVVESLTIATTPSNAEKLSCLDLPELRWTCSAPSSLQINNRAIEITTILD